MGPPVSSDGLHQAFSQKWSNYTTKSAPNRSPILTVPMLPSQHAHFVRMYCSNTKQYEPNENMIMI